MKKTDFKPAHYHKCPRPEMVQFIPDFASNILEIGCGNGSFSAEVKRIRLEQGRKIKITAIELDKESANVAKYKLDLVVCADIEKGALDSAEIKQQQFDCIICNDVLEHLILPWEVLKTLRSLLTPTGVVVASIPNVRFWAVVKGLLFDGEWRYTGEGVLDITHLRFFTRKSIERLFTESGYQIESLVGINSYVSGWKFTLLNLLTFNFFKDIQYLQFAIVAKKHA